jgi:uncharacterized protein (DUF983 family)
MTIEYKLADGDLPKRNLGAAMLSGLAGHCPACGTGRLFSGYIQVRPTCEDCGEDLSPQRADDLPAYLTILVTGHIVVPLMYMVEKAYHPEYWVHLVLWLPMVLILSLGLLRPLKGAVVGLQWANYMHGFDPRHTDEDEFEP